MSEENPWKTLESRIVYQNPWLRVREDQVIRPDGEKGIYGVIETSIATGAVAITPSKEVYLVGQYRYTTNSYSWEIVEGGTEEGETPLAAAKRELQEEAGLEAAQWQQLGAAVHLSNCISSEEAYLFLAEELREVPSAPEGTEQLQIKKVPLADCLRMIAGGEITDAVSIIALQRAADHFAGL